MAKVDIYNQEGVKTGQVDLPAEMWEVTASPALIKQTVVVHRANSREVLAHTKTRSEVRGGGKKPWRQKGTGRARQGSIRSPLWRGGGVTFGPRNDRNYTLSINKKARKKALFAVLSNKLAEKKVVVLDSLVLGKPRTKEVLALFQKLPNKNKKTLIALPDAMENVSLSIRNVPKIDTMPASSINVYELLNHEYLLLLKESLKILEKTYLPRKVKEKVLSKNKA